MTNGEVVRINIKFSNYNGNQSQQIDYIFPDSLRSRTFNSSAPNSDQWELIVAIFFLRTRVLLGSSLQLKSHQNVEEIQWKGPVQRGGLRGS